MSLHLGQITVTKKKSRLVFQGKENVGAHVAMVIRHVSGGGVPVTMGGKAKWTLGPGEAVVYEEGTVDNITLGPAEKKRAVVEVEMSMT